MSSIKNEVNFIKIVNKVKLVIGKPVVDVLSDIGKYVAAVLSIIGTTFSSFILFSQSDNQISQSDNQNFLTETILIKISAFSLLVVSLLLFIVSIIIIIKNRKFKFYNDRKKVPKRFSPESRLKYIAKKSLNLTVIGRTNIVWFENIDKKEKLYKKAIENGCEIHFIIQHETVENNDTKDEKEIEKIKRDRINVIGNYKKIRDSLIKQKVVNADKFIMSLTEDIINNSITAIYDENNYFYYFSYDIGLNYKINPILVFLRNSVIIEFRNKMEEIKKNAVNIFIWELLERYSGFLKQRENNNEKLLYHYFNRKKPLKKDGLYPPVSIQLLITNRCTTECIMCDHHLIGHDNLLNKKEIENIIDNIYEVGTRNIIISGGEPLANTDCIEILEYAKDKGLNVGLLTNGVKNVPKSTSSDNANEIEYDQTSISLGDARRIKRACDWVQLSIDSFDPETYKSIRNFDLNIVRESLKNMEKCGVNLEIVFTIQKNNFQEAIDIITEAEDEQIFYHRTKIRFKFAHGHNDSNTFLLTNENKKLKEFLRNCKDVPYFDTEYIQDMYLKDFFEIDDIIKGEPLLSRNRIFKNDGYICHALHYSCLIDAEGNLYPCCFLYDDNSGKCSETRNAYKIGSLRTKDLIVTKEGNRLKELLIEKERLYAEKKILPEEKVCNYCTRHFYQNAFLNEVHKIVEENEGIGSKYIPFQKYSDNKIWL